MLICIQHSFSPITYSSNFVFFFFRERSSQFALGAATLMFMVLEDLAMFPNRTGWGHGALMAMDGWPKAERDAFALVGVVWCSTVARYRSTLVLRMIA